MADRQASLTGQELAVMDLTAQLADALGEVVGDGPSRAADLAELCGHLHGIQRAVMAQAAARRYPQRFRLLGATVGEEVAPCGHELCGADGGTCPRCGTTAAHVEGLRQAMHTDFGGGTIRVTETIHIAGYRPLEDR